MTVLINDCKIDLLIDSRASTNVIVESKLAQILPPPQLSVCKINIYPYQAAEPLKTLGKFQATITTHNTSTQETLIVASGQEVHCAAGKLQNH